MSQQEFAPQSQSHGQEPGSGEEEIYQPQYPYSWSGKLDREAGPRDEPPSSYTEPAMQHGYRGQDHATYGSYTDHSSTQSQEHQTRRQQQYYSPDGDAFEYGYRPYNRYNTNNTNNTSWQGVPPWARPQQHRGAGKWILFLVLGFFLIKPILVLLAILLAFAGVAALALVLPILLLLVLLGAFRLAFWPGRWRSRGWRYRRGSWWG